MNLWPADQNNLRTAAAPTDPYFKAAYDFSQDWLRGQEEFWLHTSGSTGTPKPIRITRSQMEASARMTGKALALGPGTKALGCLNTRYIAGRMMLVRALVLDWQIHLVEPSSNPLTGFVTEPQFDFVAMVPMQLATCLRDGITRERVERCGLILLGGAPLDRGLEAEIQQLRVPVYQSYGMTETVSHVALRRVNGPFRTDSYQLLEEIDFGVDERDCLWVQGAVTNYERVQTNDLVALQAGKAFLWLGRADSVINSGGVKIQLDKLDRVAGEILGSMQITNLFFHGSEPDPKLGERLVLFIEKNPGVVHVNELLAKFAARVNPYEVPKAVYMVDEFARTPTAKIDKKATERAYFSPNSPR